MLLVWVGPGYGELDQQALLAILSTSCVIAVPLLNWSETLRLLGVPEYKIKNAEKNNENVEPGPTRTIIVYWAFLVTIGFMCVFVSFEDHKFSVSQVALSGTSNISCTPAGGNLNLSIGQDPGWHRLIPNSEFIAGNNCLDPCRGVNPIPKGAIFRTNDDLEIPTQKQIGFLYQTLFAEEFFTQNSSLAADVHLGRKLKRVRFFKNYVKYALFLFPYILLQGFWAICFGRRRPRQVRDSVYLFIAELNLWTNPAKGQNSKESLDEEDQTVEHYATDNQLRVAFFVAYMSYLWAVVIAVICPPLFVINLIANEVSVNNYPESENGHHIGAWAPYVATVLVFGAALIAKFHQVLEGRFIDLINLAIGLLGRFTDNTRAHIRTPKVDSDGATSGGRNGKSGQLTLTFLRKTKSTLVKEVVKPSRKALSNYYEDVKKNLRQEKENFERWYAEPVKISRHTDRHGFNIKKHDYCIIEPKGQWYWDAMGNRPKNQFRIGPETTASRNLTDFEIVAVAENETVDETANDRINFDQLPGTRHVRGHLEDLGVIHPKSPTNSKTPNRSRSKATSTRGRYSKISILDEANSHHDQTDLVPGLPHRYKFAGATTVRERSISDISSRDDDHLMADQDLPIQDPNDEHIHPAIRGSLEQNHGDHTRTGSQATTVVLSPRDSVFPNPHINHGIAHELPTEYSKSTHNSAHTIPPTPSDNVPPASPGLQQSLSNSIQSRKRRSQQVYAPDSIHLPSTAEDPNEVTASTPVRAPFKPPTSRYAQPLPPTSTQDRPTASTPSSPHRPISVPSPIPFISEEDIQKIGEEHGPPEAEPEGSPNLITFSPSPGLGVPQPGFDEGSSTGRAPQRSTVSYLQVERPRTMLFDDVITLRKVDGVYRIVEPGEQA